MSGAGEYAPVGLLVATKSPHRFQCLNSVPDVPNDLLHPRDTWQDKAAYDAQARQLAERMQEQLKCIRG